MRLVILLIFLSIYLQSKACDCEAPELILEAYNADAVFVGRAIEKVYSKDSSYYTITFEVVKHYKNLIYPFKRVNVRMVAEGEYSGIYSSCDWHINNRETWLILGSFYQGEFYFDGYCGNSQTLGPNGISPLQSKVLGQLNEFNILDYQFSSGNYFEGNSPMIDLDSLSVEFSSLGECQSKALVFNIDRSGKLTSAYIADQSWLSTFEVDSTYLIRSFEAKEPMVPKSKFEEKVIAFANSIKQWTPLSHKKTGERVSGQVYSLIYCDERGFLKLGRF
ncbi:MAG: hypothetical protein HWE21_00820 [Cytophagia bacterium]|nr:hypothetical protein [Cytophagia bacterium]